MKTLDEVIKAIDFCKSGDLSKCKDCPYIGTCELDYAALSDDALHYLKEYRSDKLQWKADKEAYEDERQKAIHATKKARERYIALAKDTKDELAVLRDFWAEQQANPALSLKDLKQMEGKPVWVEHLKDGSVYKAGWSVIIMIDDSLPDLAWIQLATADGDVENLEIEWMDMGQWQAYRRSGRMDNKSAFEQALDTSNLEQAARELFRLYAELQKAGFDKAEAMMLIAAMTQNGRKDK